LNNNLIFKITDCHLRCRTTSSRQNLKRPRIPSRESLLEQHLPDLWLPWQKHHQLGLTVELSYH